VDVGKDILEHKKMVMMLWAHNENSKKQTAMKNCRMGTRRNKKEGKTK